MTEELLRLHEEAARILKIRLYALEKKLPTETQNIIKTDYFDVMQRIVELSIKEHKN